MTKINNVKVAIYSLSSDEIHKPVGAEDTYPYLFIRLAYYHE